MVRNLMMAFAYTAFLAGGVAAPWTLSTKDGVSMAEKSVFADKHKKKRDKKAGNQGGQGNNDKGKKKGNKGMKNDKKKKQAPR